jgi:hypothetical protein
VPDARYGIVTTGKGHLDLMEALRLLGIDRDEARRIGIDVYKVGMVWPLEHDGALEFVTNKREVLVIEEKRGIIESQFKEYFYDRPGRKPERMVGKFDEREQSLVPWVGELSPVEVAGIVARRLDKAFRGLNLTERADRLLNERAPAIRIEGATRMPYFCSGCPHNTSTKLPEGSTALAGIGCHFMASWMDRDTHAFEVQRQPAHLPESRRRHVLPFRLARDPAGGRRRHEYHVQDPLQRRGRDDRRSARRWPAERSEGRVLGPRRRDRTHCDSVRRTRAVHGRRLPARHDVFSSP